ncbi:ribbon-helix-helix protein, CopG family [Microcoleus sp. AR_TQ3_B6]
MCRTFNTPMSNCLCEATGRSKSDVLRELIRSLKTKRKLC